MEPDLPFEFVVIGTAVSLQSSPGSIAAWKTGVRDSARQALPEGSWLLTEPVCLRIYVLSEGRMQGDLDNRLKPILDAMVQCVYMDDDLVERIVVQRFEHEALLGVETQSPLLLKALEAGGPMVYIRITNTLFEDFDRCDRCSSARSSFSNIWNPNGASAATR